MAMSVSGSQTPRRSDMERKLKQLLQSVEKAHKADIQTYSSGHLAPNSLTHKPLYSRPLKPNWNKPKRKDVGLSQLQERSKMEANVEETTDALHSFTIAPKLQEPGIQKCPESSTSTDLRGDLGMAELANLRKAKQGSCTESDTVEQDSRWFTPSHEAGLTWRDRLCQRQRFDTQVLKTKDLTTRKCLSGREAAKRHERKLQQALRKLPASGGPRRERLTVFSDVFDDVCDGSPVFGSVLREIKTEYDLYMKSLLSFRSPLQDKSAGIHFRGSIEASEVKEAARQVSLLEQEVRRTLEENDRVRTDFEDAQAKVREHEEHEGQKAVIVESSEKECELSSIARVEAKTQQVWKVRNEVQRLQKVIRETMVSTVTTSALENCIRDSEEEVLNLAASNVLLQKTNKDLEQNISMALSKAKVSEETKMQVWEEIWTSLNGHD